MFIESIKSVPGNFAGDDKKSKAIREQRKCFGFPNDLTYESEIRIGWSYRWKNQCPEGMYLFPVIHSLSLSFDRELLHK